MIYLASPYTHKDKATEEGRYHAAMAACASYAENGEHVYSPIVHWHNIANLYDLPTDAKFWHDHNMHMLAKADSLHILNIDGYLRSKGIQAEISEAKRLGIPVLKVNSTYREICNKIVEQVKVKASLSKKQ